MKSNVRWMLVALVFLAGNLAAQEVFFKIALDSVSTGGKSTAKGSGYAVLSSDRKNLRYDITVNKLSGNVSAAHFHFVPTGGVLQGITFNGKTASGTWSNVPDTIVNALFSGNVYVNVHTGSFPSGEIRGTLEGEQFGYPLVLNGAAAGTSSAGRGSGYLVVRDEGNNNGAATRIGYRVTYAGMSGNITAAHFHILPGGGVVKGVSFADSTLDEEWVNPPDSIFAVLLRKNLYLNVHSTTVAGGEIRANIPDFVGEIPFAAVIDGAQASTVSTAKGTAWAVLRPDLTLKYNATYAKLQGNFTAAHFHTTNGGGVIRGVTFSKNHLAEEWNSLSNANLSDLMTGKVYLNIHSSTNGGGEIRGNMKYRGTDGLLTGVLNGAQASTASQAKGTVWVAFTSSETLQYHATIANLEGTFSAAHFHILPGGGVTKGVTFTDSTTSGDWVPTEIQQTSLLTGKIYLNVHSSIAAGGEIRADLKIGSGVATSAPQQLSSVVPDGFTLEQNYPNPFNPATTISYQVQSQSQISLKVFDLLGKEVASLVNDRQPAGTYAVRFDASRLSSGLYFYTLTAGNFIQTKKMLLLK